MSERPFMQLYVSDFVGDTMHLTTEQIGAYLLLLMAMWNADGTLPNDASKLARVTKVPPENWAAVWSDIAPYFDIEGGKISHGRLSLELAKFARKSAARSDAGKRGAFVKSLKNNKTGQAIASGLLKHSPETRIKKGAQALLDPTEGTVPIDRWQEEALFKACERIRGKQAPAYMQRYPFPAAVVAQARKELSH